MGDCKHKANCTQSARLVGLIWFFYMYVTDDGRVIHTGLSALEQHSPHRCAHCLPLPAVASIYTLLRIINIEKRRDSARGNRYLVELELMERGRSVVRLSEYIYLLLHRGRQGDESLENTDSAPPSAPSSATAPGLTNPPPPPPSTKSPWRPGATPGSTAYAKPLLCQPVMLQWRKDVMVHFVVPGPSASDSLLCIRSVFVRQDSHVCFPLPSSCFLLPASCCHPSVKNQARWVQQFISDMENLHRQTKDDNFSIIIVDFESEDMDVEQALRESSVPRSVSKTRIEKHV